MTIKQSSPDTARLVKAMQDLFNSKLGGQIQTEIVLFDDLKDQFIKQLDAYHTNSSAAIEKGSLQVLLFENARFSDAIFTLLDEKISEVDSSAFMKMLEDLKDKAFELLEIVPENQEVADRINAVFSNKKKGKSTLPPRLMKIFGSSGNKKTDPPEAENEKPAMLFLKRYRNRNFFFHYLVTENLSSQIGHYEAFVAGILDLLNYLVEIDRKRIALFGQFAAKNYDVEAGTALTSLQYDADVLKKLITGLHSSGKAITNDLNAKAAALIKMFDEGNPIENFAYKRRINVEKEYAHLVNRFSKSRTEWYNTVFLLSEDWKLDSEIHSFRFYILKEYFNFSQLINSRFTVPVEETIQLMNAAFSKLKTGLEKKEKNTGKNFEADYTRAKIEFKKDVLFKIIPALKDTMIKAEMPKAIDNIENGATARFSEISNKRYIVKKPEYNRPIERSEFETISLYALVGYEIMPGLKAVFPNLKIAFIQHGQTFENKVAEIPEIIDFAIESSIAYFEKEGDAAEAINISVGGVARAEKKLSELALLHESFIRQEVETLKFSIEQFIEEITAITDSESAFQINIRIARLKAVEKSKAIRANVMKQIRNFIPVALAYATQALALIRLSSETISKQFRVADKSYFIASDTSDYLSATEASINKLPFVYQRLFKIEPLTTFELFVGREKPIVQLGNAYKKWKDGKFAPVVIVGEKGSGKTTLVNWFLKTKIQNEKVIFLDLHGVNKQPEEIYADIESQILAEVDAPAEPGMGRNTIIVVDGLARLFSAEINGFKYLLKTMKLISETHTRVFWIAITHLYSWGFMEKSYGISEYFAYHIKLTDLKAADLKNIIERRHKISGYRLVYEPSPSKKGKSKYKNAHSDETQAELEEAYFKSLTEFNKNNLSQAFLYWLRSTTQVKDDVIYIMQNDEMDSSFIKSIHMSKMIVLRNILIHNGITVEGHARIFGYDSERSKLNLDQMKDDGLIIKNKDYYLVNPLIYSQIISELYLLNLLH